MKFRIIKYYDRFQPQILSNQWWDGWAWKGEWSNIGSPNGYSTVEDAKGFCQLYKKEKEEKIVEIFEL